MRINIKQAKAESFLVQVYQQDPNNTASLDDDSLVSQEIYQETDDDGIPEMIILELQPGQYVRVDPIEAEG